MKIFYKTSATATGGRTGVSELDDGAYSVQMARPETNESGHNPEQLFALGYAACFDSAMELTAKKLGIDVAETRTTVAVGIGQNADGGFSLDIDITARVPGLSEAEAQRLVEATHNVCPYSNATRGNIDVRLHVETDTE